MRIGFDGSSLKSTAGGVRRYASELIHTLARTTSHEIVLFGAPAATPLPVSIQRRPVKRRTPTNLGWSLVDLPLAVGRERLDVFHAPAYTAPLRRGRPLVLTIHDVSYERHPEWYPYRRGPMRRWFYRRSAMSADIIITDSEFSRAEISDAYSIDPERIVVVPLGVGRPFLGAIRNPENVFKEPYLLHVGDLHTRRNLGMLIRALAHGRSDSLIDRMPLVVLAGVDRGERARLEDEARRARVSLCFAGVPADATLAGLYAGAAAFVYPSRYEGFGLPLLEAMACGAPVIAARAGAIPEVVGNAGILVDPDDESAMASAIAQIIHDGGVADRLRETGRLRASAFTWERTTALTVAAYGTAMSLQR